jgi:uncharacterized membrane protein (GlpM family)
MPKVSKVKEKVVRNERNPGMRMFVSYVVLAAVSAAVIYLANMWFPGHVVLGTVNIPPMWGVLLSALAIALIDTFAMPFLREWEIMRKRDLSSMEMMIAYFVINFGALWLVSRFAEIFGLGVASWVVVVALAAVLDFVQGVVMMGLQKSMEK